MGLSRKEGTMSTDLSLTPAAQMARLATHSSSAPRLPDSGVQGVDNVVMGQANADGQPGMVSADGRSPARESLENQLEGLNQSMQLVRRELHFSLDEESGRTVVKVFDSKTDEVLRQIPSEDMLRFIQHFKEMMDGRGLLVQDKA